MSFDEYDQTHCILDALEAAELESLEQAKARRTPTP